MEAAAITEELYQQFEGMEVPSRLHINMNGCASACYNAMYDDIGLVYQKESFDVYLGAVPMGKNAQAGELFAKRVPVQHIENFYRELSCSIKNMLVMKNHFTNFTKEQKHQTFGKY